MTVAYDKEWQEKYRDMIATPQQALKRLRPGQRVFIGTGCAEPVGLVEALTNRAGELTGVETPLSPCSPVRKQVETPSSITSLIQMIGYQQVPCQPPEVRSTNSIFATYENKKRFLQNQNEAPPTKRARVAVG